MEIFGYSERGAMNALFYGMALKSDNDAMKMFLKSANISKLDIKNYVDFTLYMECSLSDFGDPDLVIIGEKKNKKHDVFFVEAKVSHRGKFSLKKQRNAHEEYCPKEEKGNDIKYDASNLFFQIRLKELYYSSKGKIERDNQYDDRIKYKKGVKAVRTLGKNQIVEKFSEHILKGKDGESECDKAYFIVIIPKCDDCKTPQEIDGIKIHIITWEKILSDENLKKYLKGTMQFNQKDTVSQILTSPWKEDDRCPSQ